ncbi:MAG: SbcC/MukB-like Walker B domain-containing protein, partial [Mariprofundales bacterium]
GRQQHADLEREITSLKQRKNNIPEQQVAIRAKLCAALALDETTMPFAGELIQVREDDRDWQGAAERLLHGFGLSLLVPDARYGEVAAWVDQHHLQGRLVYFRVREGAAARMLPESGANSLVRKLEIKPDSPFYGWLEQEIAHRFDYACCDNSEQFQREARAITRSGQIKAKGGRHEKDDRHRIDDRSRFVLGWSNAEKIAALEAEAARREQQLAQVGGQIATLMTKLKGVRQQLDALSGLKEYRDFADIDWKPLAVEIEQLQREKAALEAASDRLRALSDQRQAVLVSLAETERLLKDRNDDRAKNEERRDAAQRMMEKQHALLAAHAAQHQEHFTALDGYATEALKGVEHSVESCDSHEQQLRNWLQARIDGESGKLARLRDSIIRMMGGYNKEFALETSEVDADLRSAHEYKTMLEALNADDLPRFEARFKELLNENTIREIANFQSQLLRERETIKERIEHINGSLTQIDYVPGRYIKLLAQPEVDSDIRSFQQALRACTEGALTGSEDTQYSEAKFLQVKQIIERFRGREGMIDADQRWMRKVSDVRSWFRFAASERWREDDSEYEHYADSGGKSGGQKEKLAYTILAASLAYQFGLEWNAVRSRSFRFVVIDEAFGRGSDESAEYGLRLFAQLNLQLLIVTPMQKIHIIEPHVRHVGFISNQSGQCSSVRNLTIAEFRQRREAFHVGEDA